MNIILTGGGTAGHVMPNIALLPYLKKYFDRICYVGSENGIEKEICKNYGIDFFSTDCIKFCRQNMLKNLKIPFEINKCTNQGRDIIEKTKPDIIFAKGGYVSLPICLAGKKTKVPVVAHESDRTLGLANKIISRFACKTITSYSNTHAKNGVFIGNPIRSELFSADGSYVAKQYNFTIGKPIILVVGGSSGATAINEVIYNSLPALLKKYCIIHITGKYGKDIHYPDYACIKYAQNIFDLYKSADIIISRAGANAINEITAIGKRLILVPLPKGNSRGDQIINAMEAQSKNLAKIIEQQNLNTTALISLIDDMMTAPAPQPAYDKSINEKIAKLLYDIAKNSKKNDE